MYYSLSDNIATYQAEKDAGLRSAINLTAEGQLSLETALIIQLSTHSCSQFISGNIDLLESKVGVFDS